MPQDIDLLGDYRARHSGNSDFWNMTLAKLASIPELRARAKEKQQEMELQRQRVQQGQQEIDLRGQEMGMQQQQMQAVQQSRQKAAEMAQKTQTIVSKHMVPGRGGTMVLDMKPIMEELLASGGSPESLEPYITALDKMNAGFERFEKERKSQIANLLDGAIDNDMNPAAVTLALAYGEANELFKKGEKEPVYDLLAKGGDPKELKARAIQLRDTMRGKTEEGVVVPAGGTLASKRSGQVLFQAPEKEAAPKSRQQESVLLDGKPAKVTFDPGSGAFFNASGEDVSARVKPLPPASVIYPSPPKADKLVRVEHKDASSGKTVIEYLPESEVRGKSFDKGDSATAQGRLASAQAVIQTGNDIITQLRDPNVASKVGPAMGRFNTLRDFLGNPPPELAELAGSIESYALSNMGVHGMRSVQGAKDISEKLDKKYTPQALIAFIEGLNKLSSHLMENAGREVPTVKSKPNRDTNPYPQK